MQGKCKKFIYSIVVALKLIHQHESYTNGGLKLEGAINNENGGNCNHDDMKWI